jgi:hypothetical protein
LRLIAPQREEIIAELKVGIEMRDLRKLLAILGIAVSSVVNASARRPWPRRAIPLTPSQSLAFIAFSNHGALLDPFLPAGCPPCEYNVEHIFSL